MTGTNTIDRRADLWFAFAHHAAVLTGRRSDHRIPGSNQEPPGLVATATRWMKRVNEATDLPEEVLPVQLFVPDMFGNDVLITRSERVLLQ